MELRMKQLLTIAMSSIIMLFSLFTFSVSVSAQASLACDGLSVSAGGDCDPKDTEPQVGDIIEASLNILSFVAGIIAVIMVIIAGVRFITSQGDPGKVAGARSAIIYAVIGLVIVAIAQTIVFFVIKEATNTPSPPAEDETTEIIKTIAYDKIM